MVPKVKAQPVASSAGTAALPAAMGTPQSEGEEGIERAAEYLALLQKGRELEESAKKAMSLQRALQSEGEGGPVMSSTAWKPPLPGSASGKRKRDSTGSDEGRRGTSFTPIISSAKNVGENAPGHSSPGIPVFSLRSASPNSMNIASALSLLAGHKLPSPISHNTHIAPKLVVTADRSLKLARTNSSASDATTSEDDSFGGPSPTSSDIERKDSIDGSSSNSDIEIPDKWAARGLVVRGVAIVP